jgi:hypothetical protein
MTSRRVWIADTTTYPSWLTCGHSTHGNGRSAAATYRPPRVGDAWGCNHCAVYLTARLAAQAAP